MTGIGGKRLDLPDDILFWRYALAKQAFIGSGTPNAGAALNPCVQLWNPAASGFILICHKIHTTPGPTAETFMSVSFTSHAVALTTDGAWGNKYQGEAVGVGKVLTETPSGVPGTALFAARSFSSDEPPRIFTQPFIIPPGLGIVAGAITTDTILHGIFEWIEVSI